RILVAQSLAQLYPRHDADRLGQRAHRAVMEVRGCHRDVSQARHLEDVHVAWLVRHVEPPFVRLLAAGLLPVILDDAKLLEHAAADAGAVVAGDASGFDELAQAGPLGRGKRINIAREVSVKRGGGDEGTLVGADGLAPIILRHRVLLAQESLPEHLGVAGDCLDHSNRGGVVGIAKAGRADQGLLRLILDILAVAAPMLLELQRGIENGGGISRVQLILSAARLRQTVGAIEGWLMAASAAYGAPTEIRGSK